MNKRSAAVWKFGLAGAMVAALMGSTSVFAQTAPSDSSVTSNLIRLLVSQKLISKEAGDQLLAQAVAEARAQADEQAKTLAQAQNDAQAKAAGVANMAGNLPPPGQGDVRVAYVPEIVKKQIREELRQDALNEAKAMGWGQPDSIPQWTKRITLSGDIRVRSESQYYSKNNIQGLFTPIDFARFNASGPTDVDAGVFPRLNTTQNRLNLLRVRARLALKAKISDQVSAGVRIATGSDTSPVSTNQTLGGGFAKKSIWLDLAWVRLQPWKWASLTAGRMSNPFFATELVYDSDLNFDGIAVQADSGGLFGNVTFGVAGGAFPLEYGDGAFPTNSINKSANSAKWLYAAQLTADWKISERTRWKTGVGYYNFDNVQGRLSSPCVTSVTGIQCDTDQLRPAYMQKGNTLFDLRDAIDTNGFRINGKQYAGLIFDYNLLNITSEFRMRMFDRNYFVLTGDYVRNLAYRESDVCRAGQITTDGQPLPNVIQIENNIEGTGTNPCDGSGNATFRSGSEGWMIMGLIGVPNPDSAGDWNFGVGYKRIEPDAVLDGLTDSDFHLGGTNAKGYFITGAYGLYDNVNVRARWLSANEVYGPPLAIDVLQFDLNVGF